MNHINGFSLPKSVLTALLVVCNASLITAQVQPRNGAISVEQLGRMDAVINQEISAHHLPGAVVLVGRDGRVVWRKAYGSRAIEPARERMTANTIFDLASLTKVVATAT